MLVSMKYKILFTFIALFTVNLCLDNNLVWGTEAERQAKDLA